MGDDYYDPQRVRERERYARLRQANPEMYERAVYVGSLVTTAPPDEDRLRTAARVESAVVALLLEMAAHG